MENNGWENRNEGEDAGRSPACMSSDDIPTLNDDFSMTVASIAKRFFALSFCTPCAGPEASVWPYLFIVHARIFRFSTLLLPLIEHKYHHETMSAVLASLCGPAYTSYGELRVSFG
jgi:hypothetical protein